MREAHSYTDSPTLSYPNSNGDSHSYGDIHAHAYSNSCSDADADAHSYTYTKTYAHSEEHTTGQTAPDPGTAPVGLATESTVG